MVENTEITDKAEKVAASVVDAAMKVRTILGIKLLSEVYEFCLLKEIESMGLKYKTHVSMPVTYEGRVVNNAYIIDILVEDSVIVKVKPTCSKPELYKEHVHTYMRHSGYPVGMLLDFDTSIKKNFVNRVAL
jgi:GxxExxY protein